MSEQLKPCPFCGEQPHPEAMESRICSFYVHCPHCGMCGPELLTKDKAVSAWNTRATQPQAPQGGWQPIETAPDEGVASCCFSPRLARPLATGKRMNTPQSRVHIGPMTESSSTAGRSLEKTSPITGRWSLPPPLKHQRSWDEAL